MLPPSAIMSVGNYYSILNIEAAAHSQIEHLIRVHAKRNLLVQDREAGLRTTGLQNPSITHVERSSFHPNKR
jgi:hypothetical protein